MRWLFYSMGGWGVGHAVRAAALARRIRKQAPESGFLFISDSETATLLWQEGFASVTVLPPGAGAGPPLDAELCDALNPALVADAFAAFRPDALVVDAYPVGRGGELIGLFPANLPTALIYLDRPPRVRARANYWTQFDLFDLVLSPYATGGVELKAPAGKSVHWTGHFLLRSRDEAVPREEARRRLGLPPEALVAFVGFDTDARRGELLDWLQTAARHHPDWTFAAAMPPLPQGGEWATAGENLRSFSYFPLAEVWPAFDAAISGLDADSAAELLHHRVPSVFVPGPGLAGDPSDRAARIEDAGAGWIVPARDDAALAAALAALADPAKRAAVAANAGKLAGENGAERAAEILLQWISLSSERDAGPNRPPAGAG